MKHTSNNNNTRTRSSGIRPTILPFDYSRPCRLSTPQAIEREEALQKAEAIVEEDEKRFDRFLKENDRKLQEAIKKAELEVRRKQDKVIDQLWKSHRAPSRIW